MVNAALTILMEQNTGGLLGFFVSTAAIVLFGEIGPQAFCSRYALKIGAAAIPIVILIKWLLFVVAKPIAMLLDFLLGAELGTVYDKGQLAKLLEIHVKEGAIDDDQEKMMARAAPHEAAVASAAALARPPSRNSDPTPLPCLRICSRRPAPCRTRISWCRAP